MPKFGLFITLGAGSTDPWFLGQETVEQAIWAEKYGWDTAVITEHHCLADYVPDPLMAGMYIAAQTNRIKVGSYIALAALHDPRKLVEEASMLDVFSRGRLWFGVGLGYQPLDFELFGLRVKQRVSRFEESIIIMKKALAGEKVNFDGKRFHVKDFMLEPKPLQSPRPPIYLAAWTMPGANRAGRLGDGLCLAPVPKFSTNKLFIDEYKKAAKQAGNETYVIMGRDGWLAKNKETAEAEAGKNIHGTFLYYWKGGGVLDLPENIKTEGQVTMDVMGKDRWVFGTADDGIATVERLEKEFGVQEVLMCFRQTDGNPSHKAVLNQIKFWGEKVIPYFKERGEKVAPYIKVR